MKVMIIRLKSRLTTILEKIISINKPEIIFFSLLLSTACGTTRYPPMDSLELDKSVHMREPPNGFTYYLRPTNDTDEISIRLYVKVGDYNERLSEFQFAHLSEHIAGNQVYKYANSKFSKITDKFPPNSNAATRYTSTYYYATINGNDEKTLLNRLQAYANIAKMSLKKNVILNEAKCVRQELFIRSNGISLNKIFNESAYKSAIHFDKAGKSPYLKWLTNYDMGGISIPSVREFYKNWYRPDRMGLIIIGNIQNINNLEQNIITLFSNISKPKSENEWFDFRSSYLSSSPRFKVAKRIEVNRFSNWDKENSNIYLFFRVKKFNEKLDTKDKWINEQMSKAMYTMIYLRLSSEGASLWSTNIGNTIDVKFPDRNCPYFRIPAIESAPNTERENIQKIILILQEIWENGFTENEWNKQKQKILSQINVQDTTSSAYWSNQLENHFLYNEILPAHKKSISKQWIGNLSLKDINSYLRENFSATPDDIYITASEGHPSLSFTEDQVREWIREASMNREALKDTINKTSLVPLNEKASPLMGIKEVESLKLVEYRLVGIDPETGSEIFELENGVKLILNQNEPNFNSLEYIYITGTSPKGARHFSEADYFSAISAPEIVKHSGAGELSKIDIQNKLGEKFYLGSEALQFNIENNTSTISTRAKSKDIEKNLQLIYMYSASPRKDSLAFERWQTQIPKRYFAESSLVSPRTDLKNAAADFLRVPSLKSPTKLMTTEKFIKKQDVKLDKAFECYETIFGNASDFTFTIKGKYKKDKVMPLLQKYLGNLPTSKRNCGKNLNLVVKNDFKLLIGPIYHEFYAAKMNTGYKLYTIWYNLSFIFSISEANWEDRIVLDFISLYLYSKVSYILRYEKGIGTYSALTEGRFLKSDGIYSLAIYVDGIENELYQIRYECKAMIDNLKNHGISLEAKNRILDDPIYKARYKSTPKLQEKVNQYIKLLNAESFKKVAKKYLKVKNQYEFLFKENSEALPK